MLGILFLFFCCALIYAFEPTCVSCKHYIPNLTNSELSLCNFYKDGIITKERDYLKNYAIYCRSDDNLCGKNGFLYEENINKEIINKTEELENLCCGEVNELKDIEEYEQIEKELFDVFQKMKRYNTKRIYKTTSDLYKILNKNKKF
jgi:hypothetical protein